MNADCNNNITISKKNSNYKLPKQFTTFWNNCKFALGSHRVLGAIRYKKSTYVWEHPTSSPTSARKTPCGTRRHYHHLPQQLASHWLYMGPGAPGSQCTLSPSALDSGPRLSFTLAPSTHPCGLSVSKNVAHVQGDCFGFLEWAHGRPFWIYLFWTDVKSRC